MSIVLPKQSQTHKLKSLSGKLRDIAEELIADKFGIKEESLAFNSDFPFLHHSVTDLQDPFDELGTHPHVSSEPHVRDKHGGPGIQTRYDYMKSFRIIQISIYRPYVICILEAINKLDIRGLDNGRNRKIIMTPDFWNRLRKDSTLPMEAAMAHSIYGCGIEIRPGYPDCILEVEY